MEQLTLPAQQYVQGTIRLPGSKSISNRTLLLAALAKQTTQVYDLLASDDTARMLEALEKLGVKVSEELASESQAVQSTITVEGIDGNLPNKGNAESPVDLFLGNAGTAFRPITAALALSDGYYYLHGVPRMHERPIKDLVDALQQIGCQIEYAENEGYPPLSISPANINLDQAIQIRGDVSSQFLTALLMALPLAGEVATIEVVGELISKPYIEITLNLLEKFGIEIKRDGWQSFTIPANASYQSPRTSFVEGDASSASYFIAAAGIAGQLDITLKGINFDSIQGDIKFANELEKLGIITIENGENHLTISKTSHPLQGFSLDCNHIPDAAMTLAILALFAKGKTTLSNIASWRVKETDRISAMATELRKLGATVTEFPDAIEITPPETLTQNAEIDTYDDHRMAMCFSLVSLGDRGVPVTINDPNCVAKTFPDYFKVLDSIRT